ncbi:hypothetical protein OUZ56_004619 [Daphnia magna]|uniref:Uncharacterized protein n=1 Tax=Daphnia magna TaxID=35525 RepID=A0ABQ9YQC3_9CRUS|nr:hypothetical protein OUZ56_004619 [Daphnia magna]
MAHAARFLRFNEEDPVGKKLFNPLIKCVARHYREMMSENRRTRSPFVPTAIVPLLFVRNQRKSHRRRGSPACQTHSEIVSRLPCCNMIGFATTLYSPKLASPLSEHQIAQYRVKTRL